jgi:hypothetical protein
MKETIMMKWIVAEAIVGVTLSVAAHPDQIPLAAD